MARFHYFWPETWIPSKAITLCAVTLLLLLLCYITFANFWWWCTTTF